MQFATEIATFTCICCPLGCPLEVSFDAEGKVSEVSGFTCKRGEAYALEEATNPARMVTAIVAAAGALEPVSVKTVAPVPKARMREVLEAIRGLALAAPVRAGDVVIEDVCGTGIAVVATKDVG